MKKYVLLILFYLSILLFNACKKDAITQPIYWQENIGSNKSLPLLPDSNVNYFLYSFVRKKGEPIGIRIKGEFGYARYMSYNIYDNNTLSSVASLVDAKIIADVGNVNPYLTTSDPNAKNRKYTVNIFARSTGDSSLYQNSLLYDDNIENVGIILRYYIPKNNRYADVPLPELEAFNTQTGETVDPPKPIIKDFIEAFQDKIDKISLLLTATSLLEKPNDVFFYKFSGAFLYPNLDNHYLFTPITFNKNQVTMLRFKAPTFATSNTQFGLTDVRYFSICLCDAKTFTYSTTTDIEFKIAAADGYVNIVFGDEDAALRTKAAGLNYVVLPPELKNNVKGLIIYRNLLTNPVFPYNMKLVPDIIQNLNLDNLVHLENLQAQTYLSNYAPIGKKMSKQQYLQNFGGFPVSY
ncbi:MAG TPA: hypothetical protein PK431_00130 [Chitinophagales bacterium]|nr:hypothetical protein [Chitinophagales bacterium]